MNPVNLVDPLHNSSSSSSSNGVPWEPTIDLSVWSPRSHRAAAFSEPVTDLTEWLPRTHQVARSLALFGPTQNSQRGEENYQGTLNVLKSSPILLLRSSNLLVFSDRPETLMHWDKQSVATENLNSLQLARIPMLLHAYLAPAHNPITINSFYLLQTLDCQGINLGEARKISQAIYSHAISSRQDGFHAKVLETAALMSTRGNPNLYPMAAYVTLHMGPSPIQPKRIDHPSFLSPCNEAQPVNTPPSPLQTQERSSCSEDPYYGPQPSQLQQADGSMPRNVAKEINQTGNKVAQDQAAQDHSVIEIDQAAAKLPEVHPSPHPPQMKKGGRIPTRRSQRLQAKQHTSPAVTTSRNKTQRCKIAFTPNSHLSPLDAAKAIEILQATGLVISKQIEDMIDEAVKHDQDMEAPDQSMPQTPLHDAIPPLTVPGTDLFL